MKKDKFLTIYAVLDEETQKNLTLLQNEIIKKYPNGTQTLGIPFHITLGSFPLEKKDEIIEKMRKMQEICNPSSIELVELNHFDYQVVFVRPRLSCELQSLHSIFEGNYADGLSWHPHVTLYSGTKEDGKQILNDFKFQTKTAKIVGIELGEFFPTKIIATIGFK